MTHALRANDDQVYTVERVGHALAVARCCVARSRVMVLLSEAPLGAEDTNVPWTMTRMDPCSNSGVACRPWQAEKPYGSLELGGRLIMRLKVPVRRETGRE